MRQLPGEFGTRTLPAPLAAPQFVAGVSLTADQLDRVSRSAEDNVAGIQGPTTQRPQYVPDAVFAVRLAHAIRSAADITALELPAPVAARYSAFLAKHPSGFLAGFPVDPNPPHFAFSFVEPFFILPWYGHDMQFFQRPTPPVQIFDKNDLEQPPYMITRIRGEYRLLAAVGSVLTEAPTADSVCAEEEEPPP